MELASSLIIMPQKLKADLTEIEGSYARRRTASSPDKINVMQYPEEQIEHQGSEMFRKLSHQQSQQTNVKKTIVPSVYD